ncbi:Hpt domain-containing protein [bacterium]|nr:Hpt domain-containing protein [bacterium]
MTDGEATVLDLDAIGARFGGDKEIVVELLESFDEDASAAMPKLADAIAAGDAPEAASVSHALKGIAGNMGLDALYEAYLAVNAAAKHGDIATTRAAFETAERLFARFKREYEALDGEAS